MSIAMERVASAEAHMWMCVDGCVLCVLPAQRYGRGIHRYVEHHALKHGCDAMMRCDAMRCDAM